LQCVGNQSRKIAAAIQQYMQLARTLQKMKSKCHTNAAFLQHFWLFCGKNKEARPCSEEGIELSQSSE